ncbi:MobF family relaxase [Kitasatospora sp. NPDC052868]|uniref:MobF family relaxase n=1 Tax=Kitasatospora sp. NPDC052868 TaxID=3364060 RepID=UPI0037CAAFC4
MTATVSRGASPDYLLSAVASGGENYYLKAIEQGGEPAGVWMGSASAGLGLVGEVDPTLMREMYTHLSDPRRIDELHDVMKAQWAAYRGNHPELKVGTAAYRAAKAKVHAEARAEYRVGQKLRDYSKSREKKIEEAQAALGPNATPEQLREAEMKVRRTSDQARTYYDITFSAPKSWSLLHAGLQVQAIKAREAGNAELADHYTWQADQVWAAWMEGVQAGLDHLQQHAGYAREGRNAGKKGEESTTRRVDAHEWTAAAFRQHTSRDNDPQLHVHVAVWNRVQYTSTDPVTGKERTKWGAIDAKLLYREAKAAGHVSERVAEEAAVRRLGIRFQTRPDGVAREVLGISAAQREQFSSRRRTVTRGVAELAKAYEERYGHPPKAHELAKMADHVATDPKLRPRKGEAIPREELLQRWEDAAVASTREALSDVPAAVADAAARYGTEAKEFDPTALVKRAVDAVQAEKSAFTRAALVVEVSRLLPDCLGGLEAHQVRAVVEELADAALTGRDVDVVMLSAPELIPVPPSLQLADGTSIYGTPGGERYGTQRQLDREERLVTSLALDGAPVFSAGAIEAAVEGRGLNEGQERALRGILGSGRQAEVLVGPAGSGKSRLNGALHDAWTKSGRRVIGLTTSERAARVLADEGVSVVGNLAMFINANKALAEGRSTPELEQYRLHRGQLVIVDEAGMSETAALDKVRRLAAAAGAKVVYSGDHHQLTAVGAGGAFQEMVTTVGAYELEEVVRFTNEWEREASLRLREGDAAVLDLYEDHGRLFGGTREEMMAAAYQGWLADTLAGYDSLLITATQEQADQLAAMARADLVRLGQVEAGGVQLTGRGITIGVGDRVQLREIDRRVRSEDGERHAVNRDVVDVVARDQETGELTVRYDDGTLMTLPSDYVQKHVDLAYAGTVYSAQGRTVERCRSVRDGAGTRESLYVEMTRGRGANYVYQVTELDRREQTADVETPDHIALLTETLETVGAEKAATAVIRESQAYAESLTRWSFIVDDLQREQAEADFGRVIRDALGEEVYEGLSETDSYGPLIRLARHARAEGFDAEALLASALERDFDGVRDVCSVVHWRLGIRIDMAERERVRADEADVRVHVEVQRAVAPAVAAEAQAVPTSVPARPELMMAYDESTGGWRPLPSVSAEETAPAEEPAAAEEPQPSQVVVWDDTAEAWVPQQTADDVEPEAWVIAPPAPHAAAEQPEPSPFGQSYSMTTWDSAQGWVDVEVTSTGPAGWDAAEAAWMDQVLQTNLAVDVLHSGQEEQRRSELAEQRAAEAEERARWQTRVADIEGEKGEYARAAAEFMEERRLQLGQELAEAEELPQWAVSLGEAPGADRPEQRAAWVERAGTVAAFREAHGYDAEVDPIGPRPRRGAVDFRLDWDRAFRALGQPEDRMDLVGASDAQLEELVQRYQREEAWAPAHVAEQMRETYERIDQLHRETGQRQVELASADEATRQRLEEAQAAADAETALLSEQAAKLEVVHAVRQDWHEHTAETRERAQEAARQLELRRPAEEAEAAPDFPPVVHAEPSDDLDWGMEEPEPEWELAEPEPEWDIPAPQPEVFVPEQAPAPVTEQALVAEPVAGRQVEAKAEAVEDDAAAPGKRRRQPKLEGEGLDQAVDAARSARDVLDSRATKVDDRVAQARVEIREIEEARSAAADARNAQVVDQLERGTGISM